MPKNNDDGGRRLGFAIPLGQIPFAMQEEEPQKPAQPVLAQVMDLQAAYDRFWNADNRFENGALVREREGMGFLARNPPVLIVMRQLDIKQEYDREISVMFTAKAPTVMPDCIVGFKDGDGELRFCPHEMWRLESYTGEMPT